MSEDVVDAADVVHALRKLYKAVCGDIGFAQAVRRDTGLPYPWPALDMAEEEARAVLDRVEQCEFNFKADLARILAKHPPHRSFYLDKRSLNTIVAALRDACNV